MHLSIRNTVLTHWGRATHICVGKLTTIGSDNGLSPGRRQAIIWTSAGILLIGPLGTNSSEILIGVQTFAFKKMHLKMSSAKWRPSCLDLNVLSEWKWILQNPCRVLLTGFFCVSSIWLLFIKDIWLLNLVFLVYSNSWNIINLNQHVITKIIIFS